MRRWTLATAMTLLLTASACGGADPEEIDPDADEPAASEEVLVPVERSSELVDREGSTVGSAWLREEDTDVAELEVRVAGLTAGYHGIRVFEGGSCDSLEPTDPSILLPPLLVLENGVGSLSTLVGPISLDELLEGDGVTVLVDEAVVDLADVGSGSRLACAEFPG